MGEKECDQSLGLVRFHSMRQDSPRDYQIIQQAIVLDGFSMPNYSA